MVTHGFRNQTNVPAKNHNCNAKGGGFKRGDDNTLDCDLLVVDNGCRHHG
jgi:hypothetical protein